MQLQRTLHASGQLAATNRTCTLSRTKHSKARGQCASTVCVAVPQHRTGGNAAAANSDTASLKSDTQLTSPIIEAYVYVPSDNARVLQSLWQLVNETSKTRGGVVPSNALADLATLVQYAKESIPSSNTKLIISVKWMISAIEALEKLNRIGAIPAQAEADKILLNLEQLLLDQSFLLDAPLIVRLVTVLDRLKFNSTALLSVSMTRIERTGFLASLRPHQLSQLFIAIAHLESRCSSVSISQHASKALIQAAIDTRTDLEPAAVGGLLWLMARRGALDSTEAVLETFAPEILRRIALYKPNDIANVSRAYAKKGIAPKDLFSSMAHRITACVDAATPQDLLRIVTSYQQLEIEAEGLLDAVEAWADRRLASQSPQAFSWALWSFARMNNQSPRLLETAAQCARLKATQFDRLDLARALWSFGSLRYHPGEELLRHAVRQLAAAPGRFGDKAAANVLWALATLEYTIDESSLESIADGLEPMLPKCSTQSLANIAWAFATLGFLPSRSFLTSLAMTVANQVASAQPQALSITAWSLAKLDFTYLPLVDAIRDCLNSTKLAEFEGQHISNLLWSTAKMQYRLNTRENVGFIDSLATEAAARASELSSQELFNVLWGLATLRHRTQQPVIQALATEAAGRACSFTPQELSGSVWALPRIEASSESAHSLLEALVTELNLSSSSSSSFEPRHVAISIWAMGHLGYKTTAEDSSLSLDTLINDVLPRYIRRMNAHSLASCLEGLVRLQADNTSSGLLLSQQLKDTICDRVFIVVDGAKPVEFATICGHLILLLGGEVDTTVELLNDRGGALSELVGALPVPGLITLLFACCICSDEKLSMYSRAIHKCLVNLTKTSYKYNIPEMQLGMLHLAMIRLKFASTHGASVDVKEYNINKKLLDKADRAYRENKHMLATAHAVITKNSNKQNNKKRQFASQ